MTSRQQIEKIKSDFQAKLEKNSPRYRRAIIRELDYLYKKHGKGDLQGFIDAVQKYFDIPGPEKALTIQALKESQQQISELWDDYFAESTDLFDAADPNTFEKLQALYKVDFSKIKSDAGEIITEEIRRTARAGRGYEVLRSRLLKRSLGEAQSRTLAQTALAQFDNATMFEFAQQGGVEKFKYDGVLHTNTRPFCREHLGKKYTIDQIRKMDNHQGIPVETSCGGYNCTHFWTPVVIETKSKKPKKIVAGELNETQIYFKKQVEAKLGITLDDKYYKADFDIEIKLQLMNNSNAYWNEEDSTIYVGKKRFNTEFTKKSVITHEGAHARHDTRSLITKLGTVHPKIEEMFRKHSAVINGNEDGFMRSDRRYDLANRLDILRAIEFRAMHPEFSEDDISEMYSSTCDYFGALTLNMVGGGHRRSYYRNVRWQMFEWFAHCSENYYAGNPYFEHYFPEEYKLTLQFMKEIEDARI